MLYILFLPFLYLIFYYSISYFLLNSILQFTFLILTYLPTFYFTVICVLFLVTVLSPFSIYIYVLTFTYLYFIFCQLLYLIFAYYFCHLFFDIRSYTVLYNIMSFLKSYLFPLHVLSVICLIYFRNTSLSSLLLIILFKNVCVYFLFYFHFQFAFFFCVDWTVSDEVDYVFVFFWVAYTGRTLFPFEPPQIFRKSSVSCESLHYNWVHIYFPYQGVSIDRVREEYLGGGCRVFLFVSPIPFAERLTSDLSLDE